MPDKGQAGVPYGGALARQYDIQRCLFLFPHKVWFAIFKSGPNLIRVNKGYPVALLSGCFCQPSVGMISKIPDGDDSDIHTFTY
jgi:hypothetical protein